MMWNEFWWSRVFPSGMFSRRLRVFVLTTVDSSPVIIWTVSKNCEVDYEVDYGQDMDNLDNTIIVTQ